MENIIEVVQGVPLSFTAVTGAPGPQGIKGDTGVGQKGDPGFNSAVMVASEALYAGALINVWNNGGNFAVRLASAADPARMAQGFVLLDVGMFDQVTVFFDGTNTLASSLTPGRQYLSGTVPGGCTAVAPTTIGHTIQAVGASASPTVLNFQVEPSITLG